MSYCRWSTDDFACDLYVYADVAGGWTIHVAGNRVLGEVPKTEWPDPGDHSPEAVDRFVTTHAAQMEFLKTCERETIPLKHAGATFNTSTPAACADLVDMLASLGFRVPDYVSETLRQEGGHE